MFRAFGGIRLTKQNKIMKNSITRLKEVTNLKAKINDLQNELVSQTIECIKDFNVELYGKFVWTDCDNIFKDVLKFNPTTEKDEKITKFVVDEAGCLLFQTDKKPLRTIDLLNFSTIAQILYEFLKLHQFYEQ
jgi:vesicle coat complex subunit